ncbi:MAG TPA: glycoside hydrolase family 27 protein [Mobilitalea sp.]|nr:glycoside hydrolase family 27 protein [Mobilitalea sp.]
MKKDEFAVTPPMGWDSWDCYGASVTEEEVRANALYMANNLKKFNWQYIIVDIQWYEPMASGTQYHNLASLCMDEYGRLLPAVNRFPSAADGTGFRTLSDYIHSLGLKFGIHIMRGIPRQAVYQNTPIKGSDYTARDAADGFNVCLWNQDMYGMNAGEQASSRSKAAAQAYYDSIIELYCGWGVDYIKVDDLSAPNYRKEEIEMLRKAIDASGRSIVFSASPGDTPLDAAAHCVQNLNLWRVSNDFWDEWRLLYKQFGLMDAWNPYMAAGHFPDADMIPIGHLSVRTNADYNPSRRTRFTTDEQYTMMSLWAMSRSPLILGCELTDLDEFSLSLITNPEVLNINQNSQGNHQHSRHDDCPVWVAEGPNGQKYLGLFNLNEEARVVGVILDEVGLKGTQKVTDVWNGSGLGSCEDIIAFKINPHGCKLLCLT